MRTIILIMLAALAIPAVVSAAYPVEVAVGSDHIWMVADNKDAATIMVNVISGTGENAGQPLEDANVSFTVDSPWQLKDSFLVTDKKGIATTTLFATKASGTANITVTAWAMIDTETWGYRNYSAS
ncbi:MAG: Ig-like domain-containing protein, partial [Methanomicrobiales archaeon]|nr:Ig-like domain-containing protein [Methanomicrobiales archaeon]